MHSINIKLYIYSVGRFESPILLRLDVEILAICSKNALDMVRFFVPGVFMMVAGGIVAGVLLIFVEIAYKRHRGLKDKELELARNAADRWRGNIEVSGTGLCTCVSVTYSCGIVSCQCTVSASTSSTPVEQ